MITIEGRLSNGEPIASTTIALTKELKRMREDGVGGMVAWRWSVGGGFHEVPQVIDAMAQAGYDVNEVLRRLKSDTPVRDSSM